MSEIKEKPKTLDLTLGEAIEKIRNWWRGEFPCNFYTRGKIFCGCHHIDVPEILRDQCSVRKICLYTSICKYYEEVK